MNWLEDAIMRAHNRRRTHNDSNSSPAFPGETSSDVLPMGKLCPPGNGQAILPLSARSRHLYAIGATGCGKTSFLLRLIDDDLAHQRTMVVVDLRGDLVDRILLRLAATPEVPERPILLIDLRQNEWVIGFNPLSGPGDPVQRAYHVLEVLQRNAESWGVQLEETLRNCLLALAASGGTLLDIDRLLSDTVFRDQVLRAVTDPFVLSFFTRYEALAPDKQLAWKLPVLNKITAFLAVPQVRRMLAVPSPSWSLSGLLDESPGAVVLVALGVHRLGSAASLLGGLFVSTLENAVMGRADKPEGSRTPVHFYLDEFENLVSERFETFLAEGRRFGLGLTLSHQNLAQMPDGLRQMILANANTQLYFQVGAQDAATLAAEVVPRSGQKREDTKRQLTMQPVGEAFFLRRGENVPTPRVKLIPSKDPSVPPRQVQALRQAALSVFGRPANEIDEEIMHRLTPSSEGSTTTPAVARHYRRPGQFKPRGVEEGK
jgi:hypothetical protein